MLPRTALRSSPAGWPSQVCSSQLQPHVICRLTTCCSAKDLDHLDMFAGCRNMQAEFCGALIQVLSLHGQACSLIKKVNCSGRHGLRRNLDCSWWGKIMNIAGPGVNVSAAQLSDYLEINAREGDDINSVPLVPCMGRVCTGSRLSS